ncbi:hypothetical protein SAMN02910447_00460 [Ruminococcus sp. YE71]|uniref:hypothetical protein n=1 Tax=unclassified Ruminococcus TaxID=2608920 RepID=UPI000889D166|nr:MULTISPECIES: hypothetical protein [unclassified Ruminococcus]SDA11694.1 hypothetical protein SAMN02910446_00459 [Ruminococcus sp. YE78]SFW15635.1 hypothetical protein SAMN02910447_00460 [Ruminococcus sp. YE71]
MEYLDYENIVEQFLRITGLRSAEFAQEALIGSGAASVLSKLTVTAAELSEFQRGLCEYAAAAVAAYKYVTEKCVTERPVMSENGEVKMACGDLEAVKAARELREQAVRMLCVAGIADYGDFMFAAI